MTGRSTTRRLPTVALLASAGSMAGLDRALAQRGLTLLRISTVGVRPVPVEPLRARLRAFGRFDTVLLTGPPAARALRAVLPPGLPRARPVEILPAGPATARSARVLGFGRVRRTRGEGAAAIAEALAEGRPRSILYPRSNRAGPGLARRLTAGGHRVLDLIVYRIAPGAPLGGRARADLLRSAAVVALSPSSVAHLRRMVDPATFSALRRGPRWIALGERTLRSVRGHGIRGARRAHAASVEALSAAIVGGLR